MDKLTPERRSENMRRIRSEDTSPEKRVRSLLHRMGLRFRLHDATLPGKPDIVLPKLGLIVEVRGCFWHQHGPCADSRIPQSRRDYWVAKLEKNKQRDVANARALRKLGWSVITVWECQIKHEDKLGARLRRFVEQATIDR